MDNGQLTFSRTYHLEICHLERITFLALDTTSGNETWRWNKNTPSYPRYRSRHAIRLSPGNMET